MPMKPTRVHILVWFLAALTFYTEANEKKYPDNIFGSAENYDIVKSAQEVTAFRVTPPHLAHDPDSVDFEKLSGSDDLKHYKVGEPLKVDAATLTELRKLILDPKIDDPDSAKGCLPVWGVRLDFVTPKKTVSIYLCYQCYILAAAEGQKFVGGGDFDPAYDQLAAIAKRLFPNDKDIQNMRATLGR